MENPSASATPPPMPPRRPNGCLTALMVCIGLILMLPGVCVLAYAQNWVMNWRMLLILASAGLGVAMIWAATRAFRP